MEEVNPVGLVLSRARPLKPTQKFGPGPLSFIANAAVGYGPNRSGRGDKSTFVDVVFRDAEQSGVVGGAADGTPR